MTRARYLPRHLARGGVRPGVPSGKPSTIRHLARGGVILLIVLLSGTGSPAAFASTADGSPADPVIGEIEANDGQGVPLRAYASLPIVRDETGSVHEIVISICTDALWTMHLGLLGFTLDLLDWVLSFEWAEAVLIPAEALGTTMHEAIMLPGWASVAFALAGVIGGITCLRGRVGAGALDLLLSALCFALAVSFLSDPVGAIAGRPGEDAWSLRAAGQAGSEITIEVLAESGEALGVEAGHDPGASLAGSVLGSAIITRAIDHLVRSPAQEIAFGRALSGECDAAFTTALRDGHGHDAAREEVGRCDAQLARRAAQPTMWQPMTALLTLLGSLTIMLLAGSMLVLLLLSIAWGLWSALRVALWVHVAILPGVARERLVRALFDTAISVIAFMTALVMCALTLALVLSILDRLAAQGTPMAVQMGFTAAFGGVLAFGMRAVHGRMRRSGASLSAAFPFGTPWVVRDEGRR